MTLLNQVPPFIFNMYCSDHELFMKCFLLSASWISCYFTAHCFTCPSFFAHSQDYNSASSYIQHITGDLSQSPWSRPPLHRDNPHCLSPTQLPLSWALDSDTQLPPGYLYMYIPHMLQVNVAGLNSSPFSKPASPPTFPFSANSITIFVVSKFSSLRVSQPPTHLPTAPLVLSCPGANLPSTSNSFPHSQALPSINYVILDNSPNLFQPLFLYL